MPRSSLERKALLPLRRSFAANRRRLGQIAGLASAAFAVPFCVIAVLALFTSLPSELREPAAPSLRVLASNGRLLREVRADDGVRARPLPLAEFSPRVREAVLAAEDKRFYRHFGVDPIAVARAALTDLLHLRIVSGASTLTMQLARTLRPHRRGLAGKIAEAALAVRIEASLSKERILEEYLNRIAYGPNLRGYAAASEAYFGVAPASLSTAQAALIAGLPRGPTLYAVTKRPALAKRRRDAVLVAMEDDGFLDSAARARAVAEPVAPDLERPAFGAPHFVRGLVDGSLASVQPSLAEALSDRRALSAIQTTIDPELQRAAEGAIRCALVPLASKHVTAAAALVVENETGDVLAYVGSPDFFDAAALGQNDGARALRQPGSSLKPFVYAEAMTRLGYTPATVLPDVEIHIPLPGGGDYVPHDYDTKFRGPVRLREALGNSLNVPAVYTLRELGTAPVLERLHAFGFASLAESAEHYGPALALGDGEVTLVELANAYATLARGGLLRSVRVVTRLVRGGAARDFEVAPAVRVVEPRVAAMLTDILSDRAARASAFGEQNVLELGFDVAAKTGTSKGYRDNVAVGYTRDVTVAVWAGNFDGSPMADVSGITGAGPIFHAVMEAAMESRAKASLSLAENATALGLARTGICALSGEIATSDCPHRIYEWLPEGDADHAPPCGVHERVLVDVRNGLRAGPACARDETEVRTLERWRAPFEEWAAAAGRPVVPAASSPSCPADSDSITDEAPDALRIAYPFDGARFVIDPERPRPLQLLDVTVAPSSPVADVRVDGVLLPVAHRWPLAPGAHTLVARSRYRESAPVRIEVR